MCGRMGSYAIQAAIASIHAEATSMETTRWDLIVSYSDMLSQLQDSPVVALNRAIAIGMRDGPHAGLVLVRDLRAAGALSDYPLRARGTSGAGSARRLQR